MSNYLAVRRGRVGPGFRCLSPKGFRKLGGVFRDLHLAGYTDHRCGDVARGCTY